jgi:nucleoside-diphosphate-sugar epimerase
MKAFVTGGTGFIGSRVVRKLFERGYEVHALARSDRTAAALEAAGVHVVRGDITDPASMRGGMEGSDVVFHMAAWYKVGAQDWRRAEAINVGGTRNVLGLAHELGVPRAIYTSTVGVFGDTKGQTVDESYVYDGPFYTEYERTKWAAHYEVALPLIEQGDPIIIVMPGGVYGPGDHSIIGDVMQRFCQGRLPFLPGPETTFTYAHVEDIAEGHVLAAEKGRIGESYILAGPAVPFDELVDLWAEITGKRAPMVRIPGRFLRPLAPLVRAIGSVISLPMMFSEEATRSVGATYMARADKARRELGWQPRPLREGMRETLGGCDSWVWKGGRPGSRS